MQTATCMGRYRPRSSGSEAVDRLIAGTGLDEESDRRRMGIWHDLTGDLETVGEGCVLEFNGHGSSVAADRHTSRAHVEAEDGTDRDQPTP